MSAIIKNARTALLLMNERGLAPTPDNYAKIYYEVSGEEYKPFVKVAAGESDPQLSSSAEILNALETQNESIKAFIAELRESGDKLHIVELMEPIFALISKVQQAAKASHAELISTREALQEVSTELNEGGRNRTVTDLELDESAESGKEVKKDEAETKFPTDKATTKKLKQSGEVAGNKVVLGAESFFLGRRPIFYSNLLVAGYELSLHAYGYGQDAPEASVTEFAGVLTDIGAEGILQDHLGFIPITLDELLGKQTSLLSPKGLVLELTDAELDAQHIAKVLEFRARGFKFALADYFEAPVSDVVLKLLDFIKFDINETSEYEMSEALKRLKKIDSGAPIAINVETPQQFDRSRDLGIGLAEGFFFVHPDSAYGRQANPDQTMLLIVMGQLLTDVELPRIENAFQGHTELITKLLSMVNSAGMGLSRTVDSLQQALVILGRRHLMRWVQVLLYSNSDLKGAKMMMQMAATRARLMDLLCTTHADAEKRQETYKDNAFTVGILSLTDVLLGMELSEILDQIGLDEEVKQALIFREGFLGDLLTLTEKMEKAEFEEAEEILKQLRISPKDIRRAQKETLRWVNDLGKSSDE